MMDLRDHLEALAGPGTAPTETDIDADISRGRKAVRRRKAAGIAGGTAFVAAGLAAVISFSQVGGAPTTGRPGAAGTTGAASSTLNPQLVAYMGAQPKGFTIDKVPAGWFVQGDDRYGLTIAPDKVKHPSPGVDPSKNPTYDPRTWVGKIGISLESKDAHGAPSGGTPFTVNGVSGVLIKRERGDMTLPSGKMVPEPVRPDGDYGANVYIKQPSGVYLIVQFDEGLGFTSGEMTELSAGVHVHNEALQGVG